MNMKMRLKINSTSQSSDLNRPIPRHGHKYTKYKTSLSMLYKATAKQH